MKKYFTILCAAYLFLAGQTAYSEQAAVETVPLKTILLKLETTFHVKFSYIDQQIAGINVNTTETKSNLSESLQEILKGTHISFKMMDDENVVLFREPVIKEINDIHKGNVRGLVIDQVTHLPVNDVEVALSGIKVRPDDEGQFHFDDLAYGKYELIVESKKYEKMNREIVLNQAILFIEAIKLTMIKQDSMVTKALNANPHQVLVDSNNQSGNKSPVLSGPMNRFFQFALWPTMNTNQSVSGPVINNFSMNILSQSPLGLQGLEIGVIGNYERSFIKGLQVSCGGNSSQSYMHGVQVALGANVVSDDVHGLQVAGGANLSDHLSGGQTGVFNYSNTVEGGQVGGINLSKEKVNGAQVSAIYNQTRITRGVQAGTVNQSEEISGVQAGVVNIGRKVNGVQIGLINISDDNSGAAIGLLNFIKNGRHHFDFSVNESRFIHVAYKHGNKYFYTIYDIGLDQLGRPPRWSAGIGLGAQIYEYKIFEATFELSTHQINENVFWDRHLNLLNTGKWIFNFKVYKDIGIYAGLNSNLLVSRVNDGSAISKGRVYTYDHERTWVRSWFGYMVGIRI